MTNVIFWLLSIALRRAPLAWVRKPRKEFLGNAMVVCSGEACEVSERVRQTSEWWLRMTYLELGPQHVHKKDWKKLW